MTIYNRPRAEVFAENAPPSEIQPFQAWLRGLGIAFDETNGFPEMTGLNGLFNALNQYIKYLEQNGFAEWSSSLEYPVGAGVRVGSIWYRARTRNTNKPPATSQNDWAVFLNGADVASASTTGKGIVQLSNVLNSTSTSLALTAAQGKVLQDNKLDKSGGTLTGTLNLPDLIATNGVKGSLTHVSGYLNVQPYNASYNDGSVLRLYWDGNNSQLVAGKSGGSTAKPILHNMDLSGNAATATTSANCSRSIVAGNGLSGGGDLTANRTLTLGTPGTVTAATGNTVSASSHTHNLDVNSLPLVGVGQTWQSVSRSLGATYTNNTGKPIQVSVCISHNELVVSIMRVSNIIVSRFRQDVDSATGYQDSTHTATVPNGATYSVTGGSLISWAELR